MPKTLTVTAAKGGTAKTVVAANIAAAAGKDGQRVLVVDTDPQGDITFDFGSPGGEENLATLLNATYLNEPAPLDAIYPTGVENVSLIPSGGTQLAQLLLELAALGSEGEDLLAKALAQVCGEFDLVVIDTPPDLGPLTHGAVIASDLVLVPVSAQDTRALTAVQTTQALLETLRAEGRWDGRWAGVLVRVDPRRFRPRRASVRITEYLTGDDPLVDLPMLGKISEDANIHQSPDEGEPIVTAHITSRSSPEFIALTSAVLNELQEVAA